MSRLEKSSGDAGTVPAAVPAAFVLAPPSFPRLCSLYASPLLFHLLFVCF